MVAVGPEAVRRGDAVPVLGLGVWALLAAAGVAGAGLTPIDLLLAFGLLFVVPLGLGQAPRLGIPLPGGPLVGAAGILAAASLLPEPGVAAAALAMPWLAVCGVLAFAGLRRLAAGRSLAPQALLPAVALVYLAVGAAWLVISRLGARPLGFSDVIVQLTAVHFHFAGFAAPLVAAATGETLQARLPRIAVVARAGGMGAAGAMAIVAAGFVFPGPLSAAGAVLLAVSLGVVAAAMLRVAASSHGIPRALLGIAAASVVFAMVLAAAYAAGPLPGVPALPVARMAALHGTANAVGFCAGGLLAFNLRQRRGAQR